MRVHIAMSVHELDNVNHYIRTTYTIAARLSTDQLETSNFRLAEIMYHSDRDNN